MGKLHRRVPAKKYCECIDHCGIEIPSHCHFAAGHQFRGVAPHNKGKKWQEYLSPDAITSIATSRVGVVPHNKGKKREEYLSPEAIASIVASATGRTRLEESNAKTSVSLLKFYEAKGKKRESRNCDYCGELFERYPCYFKEPKKHFFCSKKCSVSWMSENKTGSNNNKWKPKAVVECAYCKKTLEVYPCHEHHHNFCDRLCEMNWRAVFYKGEGNPNWRGGLDDNYEGSFTESLKFKIKSRDDFQCQICGNKDGDIHVHHIDYEKSNYDDMNLISLCNSCHSKTNWKRQYWQKRLTDMMEAKHQSQVASWLSSINPLITGSGYIPDPYREIQRQISA